jgi:hypothetical protein
MDAYQSLVVYYFSGTGNALSAARWLCAQAEAAGLATHLLGIETMPHGAVVVPERCGRSLVGFCYPTHGFAPPWLVLKFLFRFPSLPDARFFFLNTRAGFRIWKLVAGPGVSGVAMWLPMLLFWLRGRSIVGSLPLDMPHSWISFCWPNTLRGRELIVARCRRIVAAFAARLLAGRRYYRWSIWLTLPLDVVLVPSCTCSSAASCSPRPSSRRTPAMTASCASRRARSARSSARENDPTGSTPARAACAA